MEIIGSIILVGIVWGIFECHSLGVPLMFLLIWWVRRREGKEVGFVLARLGSELKERGSTEAELEANLEGLSQLVKYWADESPIWDYSYWDFAQESVLLLLALTYGAFLGALTGHFLDEYFKTTPYITLIGFLLGFFGFIVVGLRSGFPNWRAARSSSKAWRLYTQGWRR